MDDAQRAVTVFHGIGDDAQTHQVVDLVERDLLTLEFLIDGEGAFDTRLHARRNAFAAQLRFHGGAHLLQILFVVGPLILDGARNFGGRFGLNVDEGEIFQFAAHFTHAEAVRDRRVDIQRFARDPLAAFQRQRTERAHVVQPVRQFDDDDADVLDHRQEHLAIVLGLSVFGGIKVDLTELGDAIHAGGDFFAELLRSSAAETRACLRRCHAAGPSEW